MINNFFFIYILQDFFENFPWKFSKGILMTFFIKSFGIPCETKLSEVFFRGSLLICFSYHWIQDFQSYLKVAEISANIARVAVSDNGDKECL